MALSKEQALMNAVSEARRFIFRAETALNRHKGQSWWEPSKENATARRASLDLTRALSEYRKAK